MAQQWKNLEFLSPFTAHKTFDLWNHILFSLFTRSIISFLSSCTLKFNLDLMASYSASINIFLFFSSSLHTFPKRVWFRACNSFPHYLFIYLFIFLTTLIAGLTTFGDAQTASTTSMQPWSDSHISSNLKGFVTCGNSRPSRMIHRGQWSELFKEKWWVFVPKNFKNHSLLAKPRKSLS